MCFFAHDKSTLIDVPGPWVDGYENVEKTVKGSQTYTYVWSNHNEKSYTDTKLGNVTEEWIKSTYFKVDRYERTYKYSDKKSTAFDKEKAFKIAEPIYKIVKEILLK